MRRAALTWNAFSTRTSTSENVWRTVRRHRFRLDRRVPVVERLHEGARERLSGLVTDHGHDAKSARETHRSVQLGLPRSEAILAALGVDERVRREIISRPERRLMAPGMGEAREQRPARRLTPGRGDFPRVVVAVALGQIRGQVHGRRAQGLRRQVVCRQRRLRRRRNPAGRQGRDR